MQQNSERSHILQHPDKGDLLLLLFVIPLYFFVWGRFGQKFAAGALLSLATGVACWLFRLVLKPAASETIPVETRFGWHLFFLFPLFCPLALSLWLIPPILVIAYLISFTCFGGCGRHIFNPVAVAVVFMIVGYAHTASLHPVRPLSGAFEGFRIWSAGLPTARPAWKLYEEVPLSSVFSASYNGLLPNFPGSAFGLPLLLASAILALLANRRPLWWLSVFMGVQIFTLYCSSPQTLDVSPWHPLLLGVVPAIMLIAVADADSLPRSWGGQVLCGLFSAAFAVLFIFRSDNLLGPIFSLLLAQVLSPLVIDLIFRRGDRQ